SRVTEGTQICEALGRETPRRRRNRAPSHTIPAVSLLAIALGAATVNHFYSFTPSSRHKNAHKSVPSSIRFETGVPAPCPALLSTRNNTGRFETPCIAAAIFRACIGSTLESESAVINNTAGYSTPAFTVFT